MSVTQEIRLFVYIRDGFHCYRCRKQVIPGRLGKRGKYLRHLRATVDHIVPKSRGGCDEPRNLRTCCGPCNEKRKNQVSLKVVTAHLKYLDPDIVVDQSAIAELIRPDFIVRKVEFIDPQLLASLTPHEFLALVTKKPSELSTRKEPRLLGQDAEGVNPTAGHFLSPPFFQSPPDFPLQVSQEGQRVSWEIFPSGAGKKEGA